MGILETLRKSRPARVMVRRSGGESVAVALRRGRARWEIAARTVEAMQDVEEVELHDSDGGIVAVWSPEGSAPAVVAEGVEAGESGEVHAMLDLMLRAQKTALDQQASMLRPMVEGYQALITTVTERLVSLERNYSSVLRAQFEAVSARAEADNRPAESEGASETNALIAQVLPMVMQRAAQGGAK